MSARIKSPIWKRRMFAAIAERDGEACVTCKSGQAFSWIDAGRGQTEDGIAFCWTYQRSFLELDHAVPLSVGGTNDVDNLQLLCHDCHKKKTSAERSLRLKRLFAEARAA